MAIVCKTEVDVNYVVLIRVNSTAKWIRIVVSSLILLKNILSPSPINWSEFIIGILVRLLLQHHRVIRRINKPCIQFLFRHELKWNESQQWEPKIKADDNVDNYHDACHFFLTDFYLLSEQLDFTRVASCDSNIVPAFWCCLKKGTFGGELRLLEGKFAIRSSFAVFFEWFFNKFHFFFTKGRAFTLGWVDRELVVRIFNPFLAFNVWGNRCLAKIS